MTAKIYALCDPRISDRVKRVRYVGLTCVRVSVRVAAHIREAVRGQRNLHKGRWIKQLLAESLEPECILLGECDDEFGPRMESLFHSTLKASGAPLCNLATGERALLHHAAETKERIREAASNISEETRQKRRLSALGRTFKEETRRKMSLAAQRRPRTPLSEDTKHRIGAANRGNKSRTGQPHLQETKDRIREANTGKRHTEETLAKLRNNKNGLGHKKTDACKKLMQQKMAKKITLAIADDIRATAKEHGLTQRQLAIVFGINQSNIGRVLRNEIWKHWD